MDDLKALQKAALGLLKGAAMSGSAGRVSRVLTKISFPSECGQHPWKQGAQSPPGPEHLVGKVSVEELQQKITD